jgi:hypothetical protein
MKKLKPLPSAESLWERFDYQPLTGQLIWRNPPANKKFLLGRPAGYQTSGYTWIQLRPEPGPYAAHRLVWRWITGVDPLGLEVDHANMVKTDNRFSNLRLATDSGQSRNTPKRHTWRGLPTRSRLKGVCFTRQKSGSISICAKIKVNGKSIHIGVYPSEEAAHSAYCEAAKRLHGEFASVK